MNARLSVWLPTYAGRLRLTRRVTHHCQQLAVYLPCGSSQPPSRKMEVELTAYDVALRHSACCFIMEWDGRLPQAALQQALDRWVV